MLHIVEMSPYKKSFDSLVNAILDVKILVNIHLPPAALGPVTGEGERKNTSISEEKCRLTRPVG